MGKKNPWIAAVLNFLIPGLGFIYCGNTVLAIGGVILLVSSLAATFFLGLDAVTILIALIESFALGVVGYGTARIVNTSSLVAT